METSNREWIAALQHSHDRLVGLVERLPGEVTGPSYCKEWSIAQLLSHLGSGAEISLANLEAALKGEEPPSRDSYVAIWDRWNAMAPEEQAANAIAVDEQHVATLSNLDDATLEGFRVTQFGRELDAAGFVAGRLFEHALHTWDVEVMGDDHAALPSEVATLLTPRLGDRVRRLAGGAKPEGSPMSVAVTTSVPDLSLVLEIGDEEVIFAEGAPKKAGPSLEAPGEAFLRLAYGRLDRAHTPDSVSAEGVTLDQLRTLFPGT